MTGRSPRPTYASLDPFVLPTETEGRYRMLIAAALVLVWSAAALTTPGLAPDPQSFEIPAQYREIQSKVVDGGIESLTPEELAIVGDAELIRPYALALGKWLARFGVSVLLVAVTLVGAAVIYRSHPRWRRLLHRLHPLSKEDAPDVVREIRALAHRAHLPASLTLSWVPGRFDGIAFGIRGRETLALGCPLELLPTAWNRLMRPVAYHELGHIANRDVRNQEISRGVWIATLGVLFLCCLGRLSFDWLGPAPEPPSPTRVAIWSPTIRSLPFLVAIVWFWRGLVRTREHYADLRVVAWGERASLLERLRTGSTTPPWWQRGPGIIERCIHRLGIGSFHPTERQRIAVIQDPRALFEVSSELALLTGLLLTTVLGSMGLLFDDLVVLARSLMTAGMMIGGRWAGLAGVAFALAAMVILARLLTGTLGVQVQREAIAQTAVGTGGSWGYARQARSAFLFALGLELGLLVTPASLLLAQVPLLFALGWLLTFTALTWMWLAFVRVTTRLLLASHAGDRSPSRRVASISWISAFLLTILYSPALAARLTLHRLGEPGIGSALSELPEKLVVVFVMTTIVLLTWGLAIFALTGLGTLAASTALLLRRRQMCPACRRAVAPWLVAGLRCEACGGPLATWLLLDPPRITAREQTS